VILGRLRFGPITGSAEVSPCEQTYYSPEEWSGEWKNFSQWYSFTTPKAPDGYEVSDVKYELQGDRLCHSWGECREVKRHEDGSVTLQFRMQGHDENFRPRLDRIDNKGVHFVQAGRKATSRLAVTITYVKKSREK
jgi:hypothetical protein